MSSSSRNVKYHGHGQTQTDTKGAFTALRSAGAFEPLRSLCFGAYIYIYIRMLLCFWVGLMTCDPRPFHFSGLSHFHALRDSSINVALCVCAHSGNRSLKTRRQLLFLPLWGPCIRLPDSALAFVGVLDIGSFGQRLIPVLLQHQNLLGEGILALDW